LNTTLNARIIELTLEKDEAMKLASYWKEQYSVLDAALNKDRVE